MPLLWSAVRHRGADMEMSAFDKRKRRPKSKETRKIEEGAR